MGHFQVRYASRVINYECKLFIRLATANGLKIIGGGKFGQGTIGRVAVSNTRGPATLLG